jgi:poly-D-alanine transfer protein DltD
MLTDAMVSRIKERCDEVETKEDFDELVNIYKTSTADAETIKEALEILYKKFPIFAPSEHTPTAEVAKMIKDGEADIDDITGF